MCVCVSASVCYNIFDDIVQPYATMTIGISFVWHAHEIFLVKKLCSKVLTSFTYFDIHRFYCSELLFVSQITQRSTLLKKANDG